MSSSFDLVAVEAAALLVQTFPRDNALMLPRYLWHTLDVTGCWEDVCQRFHGSIRRNELRWYRKYGYRFDTTRDAGQLEHFLQNMYYPTARERHLSDAMPISRERAHELFENGFVLRVFKGGTWVAGALCELRANGLHFCELGFLGSDPDLIEQGAMAATYLAVIQSANRMQCPQVHLTTSPPFVSTGMYQHKRRWGTRVSLPLEDQQRLWIRMVRYTPATHRFLATSPMITVDPQGGLHALLALERLEDWTLHASAAWRKQFHVPGLDSIRVLPLNRFRETGIPSVVTVESCVAMESASAKTGATVAAGSPRIGTPSA